MIASKDLNSTIGTEKILTDQGTQPRGIEMHIIDNIDLLVISQIGMDSVISRIEKDPREFVHLIEI